MVVRSIHKTSARAFGLRHENAVLRRQISRVRYQPGDRLWLAALSRLISVLGDFQAGEEQDRQPARNSPASPQRNPHEQRCDVNADEIRVFEPMTEPRIEGSSAGPSSAASSTNTSRPRRSPGQDRWPSSGTPQAPRRGGWLT